MWRRQAQNGKWVWQVIFPGAASAGAVYAARRPGPGSRGGGRRDCARSHLSAAERSSAPAPPRPRCRPSRCPKWQGWPSPCSSPRSPARPLQRRQRRRDRQLDGRAPRGFISLASAGLRWLSPLERRGRDRDRASLTGPTGGEQSSASGRAIGSSEAFHVPGLGSPVSHRRQAGRLPSPAGSPEGLRSIPQTSTGCRLGLVRRRPSRRAGDELGGRGLVSGAPPPPRPSARTPAHPPENTAPPPAPETPGPAGRRQAHAGLLVDRAAVAARSWVG